MLAGFLLVFIAIVLALGLTRFGFREMMETVDQLSEPNKELNALKKLFHEITTLDQEQRRQALLNPKALHKNFFNQSKTLVDKVDSISKMKWDTTQQKRLGEIRIILLNRNQLFSSYLKLKSELTDNRMLNTRLDSLSRALLKESIVYDTSIITTQKKTTTTYTKDSVQAQKDRKGLGKLFAKKKVEPQTTHIKVQEELSVVVDTLAVARQNKAINEVEQIIVDLEKDNRAEDQKLLHEELELIHANSILVSRVLGVLNEVENAELNQMNRNNDRAVSLVNQSILRITLLLVVFFVCAAFLVYLIWVDITRSNYYKEQLEKSRDEAQELSKIKQRFLANMSHEIRTPLQSIIGFSEQLKQDVGEQNDAVEAINSSSEHLLHIVDEVLDYSRISSGSFVMSKENFHLMGVVREVEAALKIQAQKKGLTLLLDVDDAKDHLVLGDAFRLRQVLYNLLGNAIKFTSKGYVKLALKMREEASKINCHFEISDTGIGIRREEITKIFNQFEQANGNISRNYGGTGLGLTIAKSLVEAQGGVLDVASVPGHGSTFKVTLSFDKAAIVQAAAEPVAKHDGNAFKGKVIVVDDDVMILRLCGLILAKNNVNHITFNEAKLLLNEKKDPDVTHILMDIRMPEINGVELCHELHKTYKDSVKYVALTAHVLPQEQQELLDEGFDTILSKPFREQELLGLFNIVKAGNGKSNEPPEVDLSNLRAMTLGDDALFQSIVNQFIEETEIDVGRLNENLSGMNAIVVRDIVHKLAGRTGQMGMTDVSSLLKGIEVNLVDGVDLTELIEPINHAKSEVEKILNAIKHQAVEQST